VSSAAESRHEHPDAGRLRARTVDRSIAETKFGCRTFADLVIGQVFASQDSPCLLHRLGHGVDKRPALECARSLARNEFQRVAKRRLPQATGLRDNVWLKVWLKREAAPKVRPEGFRLASRPGEGAREIWAREHSVAGQLDGGSKNVGPRHAAEAVVDAPEPGHDGGPRHGHAPIDEAVAAGRLLQHFLFERGWRRGIEFHLQRTRCAAQVDDRIAAVSADPAIRRIGDREREGGGDRGIGRIAAGGEHARARLCRGRSRGGNDARGHQGTSCCDELSAFSSGEWRGCWPGMLSMRLTRAPAHTIISVLLSPL
jgi:hypothetical protein